MEHNCTFPIRRTLSALLLLLLVSTLSWAYDFKEGDFYYNINEDGTSVTVTSDDVVPNYSGDIVIPSTVAHEGKTYRVTGVGDHTFFYCDSLISVSLPEGVTSIGSSAFHRCRSLTSISLPEGLDSIGFFAFGECSSLASVDIPSSVRGIYHNAFSGCSSITSMTVAAGNPVYDSREGCNAIIETGTNKLVAGCQNTVIPEGVTRIGFDAFSGCSSLTSIDIPASVTRIEYRAFSDCSSLTSINIPASVRDIHHYAFSGCSSITSMTVAAGNRIYDSREGCNAIIETRTNELVAGCPNTVIPWGVTCIGLGAFSDCSSLASIEIPASVTRIGYGAFYDCSSLTSINIPASVTSIGNRAFGGCSSLTSVTVAAGNPVYDSRKGCNAIIETKTKTLVVGCRSTFIPKGVKGIGESAFSSCSSLTSISLPKGVKSIGKETFWGCDSLTSVDIPKGVKGIGESAFSSCSSLISVDIPKAVESIGKEAFCYCSSLTTVICRAKDVPNIDGAFSDYDMESMTLYVPASAINAYKAAEGWKEFGMILSLEDYGTRKGQ